jgi:hypothetical protein
MLFCGFQFYPNGGIDDFKASFDTAREAKEYFDNYLRNFPFDGIIDDLAIWDRALTASEIAQLVNAPEPSIILVLMLAGLFMYLRYRNKKERPEYVQKKKIYRKKCLDRISGHFEILDKVALHHGDFSSYP